MLSLDFLLWWNQIQSYHDDFHWLLHLNGSLIPNSSSSNRRLLRANHEIFHDFVVNLHC